MKPAFTDAPPTVALDWVRKAVGRGSDVVDVRPLAGSQTSAVHALTAHTASGAVIRLVLRRYVWQEYLESEGDPPGYETNALRLLDGGAVPAPRLVAADLTGDECDVPAVLMTLVPGKPRKPPVVGPADYLRGLAEPLPHIHATPVNNMVRPYRPYFTDVPLRPPFWAKDPAMWERAITIHIGPVPDGNSFIHRDYHPGNVLWLGDTVAGVVDWANTSAGHPHADVGHCRENLCTLGPEVADRFLDAYRAVSGDHSEYDPYWDIAAAVGWAPVSDVAPSRPDLYEAFVARAVART